MNIVNIHKRLVSQPEEEIVSLFQTLATSEDKIWPKKNWPSIRFENGLYMGSHGGHGRIRYTIIEFVEGRQIKFQFTKPNGFEGTHELFFRSISENNTEIIHEIHMNTTTLKATLLWVFTVRWLHDALIEEAFDNIENCFLPQKKRTKYSIWVTLLREIYKKKSFKTKHA